MRDRDVTHTLLPSLLRALADGETRLQGASVAGEPDIEWFVACGLGPLLYRFRPVVGYPGTPGERTLLHGADLTSRVLTADLFAAVEEIVIQLHSAGLEPTLLKGIAYASLYYPEPHLRIMGDVDMLVPAGSIDAASRVLRQLGYVPVPDAGNSLHHAPPLHHPELGVHVELHHALLPPTSAAAATPPLDGTALDQEVQTLPFGRTTAGFLSPECDLMLIAAGWCRDLTGGLGLHGTPRPLVDAVVLINACRDLDWDRIERWCRDTFAGASMAVLSTYLQGHGAWRGPSSLPARLTQGQPFVNALSLQAIHAIFDRHVVSHRRPGRLLSYEILENVLISLISPRPAWRNICDVPINAVFPRREPRRFQPGFILRRIGAPFRPR